jgi:hypothetical protein
VFIKNSKRASLRQSSTSSQKAKLVRILLKGSVQKLKTPIRITAFASVFAIVLAMAQNARANLVTDGTFTTITYSDQAAKPITGQLYGQFGSDSTSGEANGSTLTVGGWDTSGYNFVYTAATISAGTQANGATAQPLQAPGESNATSGVSNGYGNTFMWGKGTGATVASGNNGGTTTITAPPLGGNIVAADAIYQVGAITQTITGLTVGKLYVLTFYWAGAQQEGSTFTKATTENWTVSLGGTSKTTATVNNTAEGFTGWMEQTFYYTATSTSEVLSFTAGGGPACEPPFALLADVDLEVVPDVSNWMIFTGFGAVCIVFQMVRRRRRRAELATA